MIALRRLRRLNSKRGEVDLMNATIIFLLLNLAFFSIMFLFVSRVSSGAAIYEKAYAKQIAFLIDSAKPGTTLTMDIKGMFAKAEKNNYVGQVISFDYEKNLVTVRIDEGSGYSFTYFTNLKKENVRGDGRTFLNITINSGGSS